MKIFVEIQKNDTLVFNLLGSISKGEMREVFLLNAKLQKYASVYRSSGSLDQVTLTPAEVSASNFEADTIFEQMDTDKVIDYVHFF